MFPSPNLASLLFTNGLNGHSRLHICVCLCVIGLAMKAEGLGIKRKALSPTASCLGKERAWHPIAVH